MNVDTRNNTSARAANIPLLPLGVETKEKKWHR